MSRKILLAEEQLKYIIMESLTDDVYHFTNMTSLKNITETDTMYLSNSFENSTDSLMSGIKYPYYLSLTRSFNDKFGYVGYMNKSKLKGEKKPALSESLNVRIEFDGRMLNSNFKGTPVNYHWKENKRSREQQALRQLYGDKWNSIMDFQLVQIRQDEDRLLSKKPYIRNISRFIKRIDVCVSMDGFSPNLTPECQQFLYSLLLNDKFKNKTFIYTNENDYNKRYRPINDKIISSHGNFANILSNNTISNSNDFYDTFKPKTSTGGNRSVVEITPLKIEYAGVIAHYISMIDHSCNINKVFENFKNSFKNNGCTFSDEKLTELLMNGYKKEINEDEIDNVLKFMKSNFKGNLRAVYSDITNELTKAFSRHISQNGESVNNYLETKRQDAIAKMRNRIDKENKQRLKQGLEPLEYDDIEKNNPTFRNMVKYFYK